MTPNYRTTLRLHTALALALLLLGGCINIGGNFRAKAQRTEELASAGTGIDTLDVSTNVGTVKIDPTDSDEIHVVAGITVKAKTEEEAEMLVQDVRIVAEPSGRKLVIKADKPSGFGRNQLAVGFTISAPARLAIQCSTNVGDIHLSGFAGRVTAKTDVGSIRCSDIRSETDVHTNVGDIALAYAAAAPADVQTSAATNVGDIEFTGPTDISATLDAHVNVGSITTDRPLTVTGKIEKSVRATLGQADGKITLRTNVGSVRIR